MREDTQFPFSIALQSSCSGIAYATGLNRGRRLKLSGEIERKILIIIFLKVDGDGVDGLRTCHRSQIDLEVGQHISQPSPSVSPTSLLISFTDEGTTDSLSSTVIA
ncbi:hypothetical protein L2E82_35824 [Cichorium intybus]|uniref:Uncharacterized protein n=1 Tax=Cichorium intybus TaxID=13427 RepID=A0ACB9BQ78_CICIN|nr:hypothetical protein L2E82_35824 [Cichorium intybus]